MPIADVILKNKLVLLTHPPRKPPSKQKMQVTVLKNDCNIFSCLYISCQTRSGDLETFFMHEDQTTPPSLSSDQGSDNNVRKQLFTQKSCSMENIPPTMDSLVQHIKRVSYQANCWNRALYLDPCLPSPNRLGVAER